MDIYYCTQGREGSNDRWEYEDGWSEGKREEKLKKKFPNPQKAVVKAEFAKRRGLPKTDVVVKEVWWGEKISANHPSQAQGFGIGDTLTAGTSDGEVTSDEDSNSGSSTSGSTSKEPWTLVTKKKQGNQLKPAEYHKDRESTDLPAERGATRDKVINKNITVPRPTYNQVTLGLRGEEEEKSTAM